MREGRILLRGANVPVGGRVEGQESPIVHVGTRCVPPSEFTWASPSAGLVYGVILNDRASLARLGRALNEPPYKVPPNAPILYVKPYNTHVGHGARVFLPPGADRVEVAATLGVVIGVDACRVSAGHALECVRGYTTAADLSLPHASYFRPAIREKCFDGACPMGPWIVSRATLTDPHTAAIRTYANGQLLAETTLEDAVRPIPQLIADITEFMTLKAGDTLLCAVRYGAPVVPAGSDVEVEIEAVGRLAFRMERARQAEAGQ